MRHKGTIKLNTKRLILRPFQLQDAEMMYKNWASSSAVTKFLTWHPHKSVDDTKCVLSAWGGDYVKPNFYQWAIVPTALGEPIGSISVVRIDEENKELEIGYCIGDRFWGNGYVAEALKRLIEFLFSEVGARRIMAKHDVENPNSGKVMIKSGMSFVEIRKQASSNITNDKCDVAVYMISNKA